MRDPNTKWMTVDESDIRKTIPKKHNLEAENVKCLFFRDI